MKQHYYLAARVASVCRFNRSVGLLGLLLALLPLLALGQATTLTCPTPNNALNFDGANDYVRGTAPLPALTAMTLEAWVYQEANGGFRTLLNGDNFPGGAVHIHMTNGTMQFTVNGSNPTDYSASTGVALNTWAHVAVVYTSTGGAGGTVKFYLNGAPLNTISATSTTAIVSQNYSVGAWFNGASERFFQGSTTSCACGARPGPMPRFWPTTRRSSRPRPA